MGIRRNLGAALTMGAMATTKLKEAQEGHQSRLELHQSMVERFNALCESTMGKFAEMKESWNQAKGTLLTLGAMNVSASGTLEYGWFKRTNLREGQASEGAQSYGGRIGGSAVSIGATIGAPVAAWSMVGALGTASTGAAISGLSGAAATSATAAWFGGGAVAARGLGMAAAPFALSGIGLAVGLPLQVLVGSKVAGRSERKAIGKINEQTGGMATREAHFSSYRAELRDIREKTSRTTQELISRTAVLNTVSELCNQDEPKLQTAVEELLESMERAQKVCGKMERIWERMRRDFS